MEENVQTATEALSLSGETEEHKPQAEAQNENKVEQVAEQPKPVRRKSLSMPPAPAGHVERVERMCVQCHHFYFEDENNSTACEHHTGTKSCVMHVRNEYDEEVWSCCGRKNRGTHPQYEVAPGCTKSRHMSATDVKEAEAKATQERLERERLEAQRKAELEAQQAETARLAAKFKENEAVEEAEKAAAAAEEAAKRRGRRPSLTNAPVRRKSVEGAAQAVMAANAAAGRTSPTRRPSLRDAAGLARRASVEKK